MSPPFLHRIYLNSLLLLTPVRDIFRSISLIEIMDRVRVLIPIKKTQILPKLINHFPDSL